MYVPLAPAARPEATASSSAAATSLSSLPSTVATASAPPAFFTASPCRASRSKSVINSDSHEERDSQERDSRLQGASVGGELGGREDRDPSGQLQKMPIAGDERGALAVRQ